MVRAIVTEALDRPADSVGTWLKTMTGWLTDTEEPLQSSVVAEIVTLYEDTLYHVGFAALQAGIDEGRASPKPQAEPPAES